MPRHVSKKVPGCVFIMACSSTSKPPETGDGGGADMAPAVLDVPSVTGGQVGTGGAITVGTGGFTGGGRLAGAGGAGVTGGASGALATGGMVVSGGAGGITSSAGAGGTTAVTSITKDGITWTFSQPVVAGQFVAGDYYAQSGFEYSADWSRQRQTKGYFQGGFLQYSFVDDMWAKCR
jgi:hypothetical protein